MFSSTLVSVLIASFATSTLAANDWKTPCLEGTCSYESGDGVKSTYSKLQLSGSPEGISDITTAAGWTITGCDAKSADAQTITLTCDPSGPNADKCSHVSSGEPTNKIIRLPESCGAGPYARIAAWETPANATKRADAPVTHKCTFDFDFSKIPATAKPVSFSVYGTSAPGVMSTINPKRSLEDHGHAYPRRGLAPRGFFGDVVDGIKGATSTVVDGVKDAASNVADGAKAAASDVKSAAKAVATKAAEVTSFDESKTAQKLAPIDFNKNIDLFQTSINCLSGSGSIDVSVATKFHADITTGFAVKGTVVPPKLDEFGLFASMDGTLTGSVTMLGSATGTFNSGLKPIVPALGLPGLSIVGIITIGPEASLNGQVTGTLNANVNVTMGISKNFNNVTLQFPPNKGPSSAKVTDNKSPFDLALGASGDAVGSAALHIIPRLDFGIDVLKGLGKATVFLELDTSATLGGSVTASVSAVKTVASKSAAKTAAATASAKAKAAVASPKAAAATPKAAAAAAPKAAAAAPAAAKPVATDPPAVVRRDDDEFDYDGDDEDILAALERRALKVTDASVNGCVTLDLGVDVRAGAVGAISPFFSQQTSVDLFKKSFQVLNKCFGATKAPAAAAAAPAAARRARVTRWNVGLGGKKAERALPLTCAKQAGLASIVNQLLI